ncbi:DUF4214 domain-containing protein [Pseudomarimonas salicorniae]|uniref:DUF4214 domain-containing protein n=1 Tax=Pseudomarimonas salicorniae TaxID=2933270 RepID=A0ABT0GIS9_9GAMM|nr:DUF4214 domain-containing protein [Lysobacter sp. CAU 1642]MCK7594459.1 DUF4214 domain-containing protein [Lysobacter sp. CAU 1642]
MADDLSGEGIRIAAELPSLLSPEERDYLDTLADRTFVDFAYRALLGRTPDLPGLLHHLEVLERGGSRWRLLGDLSCCEEGRRFFRQEASSAAPPRVLLDADRYRSMTPRARRILRDLSSAMEYQLEAQGR